MRPLCAILLAALLAPPAPAASPAVLDALRPHFRSPNAMTEAHLARHNVRVVSHFSPRTVADLSEEIDLFVPWFSALLGEDPADPPQRPETLVVFDPGALAEVVDRLRDRYPFLPDAGRISGVYLHDDRLLLANALGAPLRHELAHALHYQSIDRAVAADADHPLNHPAWITDGLSTLAESVAWEVEPVYDDGDPVRRAGFGERPRPRTPVGFRLVGLRPAVDHRVMVARNMHRTPRSLDLRAFCTMDREAFYGRRANAHYATARALFLYLHERGVLTTFYRAYRDGLAEAVRRGDEEALWGIAALEHALGRPLGEIEEDFRAWLRSLEAPAERLTQLSYDLALWLLDGPPDGVRVFQSEGADRRRTGLQYNDVITHVDGRPVRTSGEYLRVMRALQPELERRAASGLAPTVLIRYRRGGDASREHGQTRATLTEPREFLPL